MDRQLNPKSAAMLHGLGRLIATVSLMALPGMIETIGWPTFQITVMATFALAIWYFMRLVPNVTGIKSRDHASPSSF
ncbi:hypothetical protein EB810_02800 [Altererythrobacter sp. FM1]|uniref:Uncharacterized protein n=1 Tax=Tsuneonella flava TaxID=2055955 RepID=A0ABX7KCI3_9SPHN|nr:hypothetical protein [Tsuneonella flava]QSB45177.1 hypothetical protein IDJ81_03270 [Tsuneonella flava]ROT96882.1 hypothetical protein EB810_02800 [Altererythrobacter sp. FM1]